MLTPEEYGILAMLGIVNMVIHPIFSLGINAAMGPSYFKNNEDRKKMGVLGSASLICTMSSLMLVTFSWFFYQEISSLAKIPPNSSDLVFISLFGTSLLICINPIMQFFQFEKRVSFYVMTTAATGIAGILTSVVLVAVLDWGIAGMVYGQLLGNIITFSLFLFFALKDYRPTFFRSEIIILLKRGIPLTPSFGLLFLLMHFNKYVLESYRGLDIVGIYSAGFNLGLAMTIVISGITTAWYPFFMGYMKDLKFAEILFGKIFSIYCIGIGCIVLMFFIWAKPVAFLLLKGNFYDAYIIIGLTATTQFILGMYNLLLPPSYFAEEISAQVLVQCIAVVLGLPFYFIMINFFGLFGGGLAILICHLILVLTIFLWNKTRYRSFTIQYDALHLALFFCFFICLATGFLLNPIEGFFENSFLSIIGSCSTVAVCIIFLRKYRSVKLIQEVF